MKKYEPGNYLILFFDPIGRKLKNTKNFNSYIIARAFMFKFLKKYPKYSVVISRIIFNSKMGNNKWEYKK